MAVGVWHTLLRAAAVATLALASAGLGASAVLSQARTASAQSSTQLKGVPVPHEVTSRMLPLRSPRTALVEFDLAPFPYQGRAPSGRPFLDVTDEDGRRGHSTSRGVLWEDVSFSDRRALVFIPKGFDARRPGLIVVFLHGHRATIERDVRDRQKVADQIAQANANAVLIAPQFAVNASDSSAGRFWESYGFARFLGEAGEHLTRLHGDKPAYRGRLAELGAGIRGSDDRLAVRPGSAALHDAVMAWSAANGASAVNGGLGFGRDGNEPIA